MDSHFTLVRKIHDVCTFHNVRIQVHEAQYTRQGSDFLHNEARAEGLSRCLLIKSYFSSDIEVADRLLKRVIPLISTQYSSCTKLVEVTIKLVETNNPEFRVNYELELHGEVDEETKMRDDSFLHSRKGFDGYTLGQMIANNVATNVSVYEATSEHFSQPLAIKKFVYSSLYELNNAIREGIHQARAQHENTCRLLDIALRKDGLIYELGLVMERMPRSLKNDILLHFKDSTPYSEEEIWRFLQEIGGALLHAKKQSIAHCDIKPENVLISETDKFTLGDFGSSWKMNLRSVTKNVDGTFGYMAPEVRMPDESKKRPFPADIYSLGMTALCMGMLGFPREELLKSEEHVLVPAIQTKINELEYSYKLQELLRRMTHYNPSHRPPLEELLLPASLAYLDCYDYDEYAVKEVKEVKRYNIELGVWGAIRVKGELKADDSTSYLLVDANRLFCCGNGRWRRREVYVVHVKSGWVEVLPLMNHSRGYSGMLQFKKSIFVCGSCTNAGTSVEVFASNSWTLLPAEMTVRRFSFAPCEYRGKAYLFDSSNPTCIDELDLVTYSFLAPVSVQLPIDDTGTVCGVVGEELRMICGSYTAKLNLRRRDSPQVTKHTARDLYPRSSAVVVGEWMYWVNREGQAMRGGVSVELLS